MMNRISHLVNSMVSLVQERSIIAIEATIVQGVGGRWYNSERYCEQIASPATLKWVNTEWKQVEADRHELQSIPNF